MYCQYFIATAAEVNNIKQTFPCCTIVQYKNVKVQQNFHFLVTAKEQKIHISRILFLFHFQALLGELQLVLLHFSAMLPLENERCFVRQGQTNKLIFLLYIFWYTLFFLASITTSLMQKEHFEAIRHSFSFCCSLLDLDWLLRKGDIYNFDQKCCYFLP